MTNLALMVVSQTTSTITLGWTPPTGAQWYTFYTDGVRVSNAPPVSKTGVVKKTIKFAAGASQHQVVAICLNAGVFSLAVGTWDKTSPPAQPVFSGDQSFAAHSPSNPVAPTWAGDFEKPTPNQWSPFTSMPEASNLGSGYTLKARPAPGPKVFGTFNLDTSSKMNGKNCAHFKIVYAPGYQRQYVALMTNRTIIEGETQVRTFSFILDPAFAGTQDVILAELMSNYVAGGAGTGTNFGLQFKWNNGQPRLVALVQAGKVLQTQPQYQFNTQAPVGRADHIAIPDIIPAGRAKLGVQHDLLMRHTWSKLKANATIEFWHRIKGEAAFVKTVDVPKGYTANIQCKADGTSQPAAVDHVCVYRVAQKTTPEAWMDNFNIFAASPDPDKNLADAKAWLG